MIKTWIVNLSLIVAGCVVAFVIVEIGLRLAGVSHPRFYIHDTVFGYTLKPGAEGLYDKEGEAYITINQGGMRDRDHSIEKPQGIFRIAVLGDSYTEALQIPMEDTYWAKLEEELSGCPALAGRGVETLNFGVGGYSTAQEFLMWRHKAALYRPDLVLLAVFTQNDIRGNSRTLDHDDMRPYFTLHNGQLVQENGFRESFEFRLQQLPYSSDITDSLRVLQVFSYAKYRLKTYLKALSEKNRIEEELATDSQLDMPVYLHPPAPLWEQAWRVTEALLLRIKREVEQEGSRLLLVTLSNPDQVHPDLKHRENLARQLGVPDLFYPDRRIRELAAREKIELLSLAETFAAYAEEQKVFLHGFQNTQLGTGHWNASGHRLAGHLMAEKICSMLSEK